MMGRKPAPPDEYRRLLKEAREALERVPWTHRDRLWFRRLSKIDAHAFAESTGRESTHAQFAPDRRERSLIAKAWRRMMSLSADKASTLGRTGPLSLTLAEWSNLRVWLLDDFFGHTGKSAERKLERLITKIEGLLASGQVPDDRGGASAACQSGKGGALQQPPRPAPSHGAKDRQRAGRRRPLRLPGRKIRTLRELGLAMQLDDEGPLSAGSLHADATLLEIMARQGVIVTRPGSGEGDTVWVLTAEGRSETRHCRQLYMDWLGRVHAKNPVWHRTGASHPIR
ncbi:MAG: hypothetical protein NTX53_09660 [candidate division WOR-3 bacterium]|nr:hypothetical protein [candidate division WOR-3 bacterium]